MALYFYFNETTGDLVYSDQATYSGAGYTSLGEQTNMNPAQGADWIFSLKRSDIYTVSKDLVMIEKIAGLISMDNMFSNCSNLTSADLSGFNTVAVTNMASMFSNCSNLANIDLSGFNTVAVTNMAIMFENCNNLTSVDLSGFDTAAVTNMVGMFRGCSNLTSVDLSGFDTVTVTNMTDMFDGCSNLHLITTSDNMSNILSQLPAAQYYPAAGGDPVAKANLTAGTWVRDEADLSMVTSIVEQAQMSQAISRRIGKLGRDLCSAIDAARPSVDIVKTMEHSTSYTRDTLEFVVDTTGKVTSVYFIDATTE